MTTQQPTVTIGKTVYTITTQGTEDGTFFYTVKKGNTVKSLMNILGDWFLVTNDNRGSLPKHVTPTFKNVLAAA